MRTTAPLPRSRAGAAAPRARTRTAAALALVAALGVTGAATALPAAAGTQHRPPTAPAAAVDLGREVLPPGDGWASWSGTTRPDGVARTAAPTTGGVAAGPREVYVVDTWQELRDALAGKPGGSQTDARRNTVPRIVYVRGTIDAWERPDGTRTTCADLERQVTVEGTGAPFAMSDYIAAFGPGVDPSGPLETARTAAAALQAAQTLQHVGSNVTLVGVGDDARIVGGSLRIRDASNVIVRNLTLSDAYDCFPQWDANDSGGNWNSAYDNLSVWTSTSVWIDHNTFDDGDHPPATLDVVYGRPFEVHDGLVDITHGSDLVTVSYNALREHDKTSLVGSSDSRTQDRGQHRITYHHNRWTDIGQRAPRVRYGDVHVYNELYEQTKPALYPDGVGFQYYLGAGRESSIVAEQNVFELLPASDPAKILAGWGGTEAKVTGSLVNGEPFDVLAAYNATAATPLSAAVRWDPAAAYPYTAQPAAEVAATVRAQAGAGVLPSGSPVADRAPDRFRLAHDNGWDTGLHDGDYTVTATLYWGSNGTVAKLYEDGVLIDAAWLEGRTPGRQQVAFDVSGRTDGDRTYVVEVLNPWGSSTSAPLTVKVRDAAPAKAVLRHDNRDGDGDLTVTASLWWGTNAERYVLYRDGVEVDSQTLTPDTPHAQQVTTRLTGLAPGTYVFTAELSNAAGTTPTAPLTVVVRR
ncbi:hypothetical protein [Cellulomonas fimi]|uniref:pectate lyase family protein n=1 Tax=Cellulomonas fimi TaxID=1708 RepID=UPI002359DEAC|nr:hypothetical protein [Cellulomonas fimi]